MRMTTEVGRGSFTLASPTPVTLFLLDHIVTLTVGKRKGWKLSSHLEDIFLSLMENIFLTFSTGGRTLSRAYAPVKVWKEVFWKEDKVKVWKEVFSEQSTTGTSNYPSFLYFGKNLDHY